ncbi:MAG: hypothetical protein ACFBSD_13970 [Paracoccaceae bacterium]
MISVLSAIVLMVAIGTLVQRWDLVSDYFEPAPELRLVDDRHTVGINALAQIDVLANDPDVLTRNARLVITELPECGTAAVQNNRIEYRPAPDCRGEQTLRYGLLGSADMTGAALTITIAAPVEREAPARVSGLVPETPQRQETAGLTPGAEPLPADAPEPPRLAPGAPQVAVGAPAAPSPQSFGDTAGLRIDRGLGDAGVSRALPGTTAPGQPQPAAVSPAAPAIDTASITIAQPTIAPIGLEALASAPADESVESPEPFAPARRQRADHPILGAPTRVSTDASPPPPSAERDRTEIAALTDPGDPSPAWRPGSGGDLAEPSLDRDRPGAVPRQALIDEAPPERAAEPGTLRTNLTPRDQPFSPPDIASAQPADGFRPPDIEGLPATPSIAMMTIDRSVPRVGSPGAPYISPNPGQLDAAVPRIGLPSIGGTDPGELVAIAAPASGLGEVRNLGGALNLAPVETSVPAALSAPLQLESPSGLSGIPSARFDPDAPAMAIDPETGDLVPAAVPADDPPASAEAPSRPSSPSGNADDTRVAALPPADIACTTPPQININPRAGALTDLFVDSPCHAGTAALVGISGIEIGIPLDASGKGSVAVPGFESSSDAQLTFVDGEGFTFPMPFEDTERLERVVLAWQSPVRMELHAFEFGARTGGDGHVGPHNPRSPSDVRRRGGGFHLSYASAGGVGDNLEVYTHWRRPGGETGIVSLAVDFASRHVERQPGTCGNGPLASPSFSVFRSRDGIMARPVNRRLGQLPCDILDRVSSHFIEDAVEDVIVSNR